MAITNIGVKAGALAAGGSGRTAGGGQNASQALGREAKERGKAPVVPTAGKDRSRQGAGETALGPKPQELALRRILRRNQRRRHRPLLLAEMVDRKQDLPLRGKASLIRGGATTARRRSPPMH